MYFLLVFLLVFVLTFAQSQIQQRAAARAGNYVCMKCFKEANINSIFFSASFSMKLCFSSSKQMEISLSPPLVTMSVTVGKSNTVGSL